MRVALYWFWLAYRSVITVLPHLDIVPSKLHADHRMSALSSSIVSTSSSAREIPLGGVENPKYKASPLENPASRHSSLNSERVDEFQTIIRPGFEEYI